MLWLSSKKNITLLSYDCKTSFANKNIGSFTSCLGIAVNKGSPRELVRKLNFSLFFSCSIQNKLVIGFFKQEADWMIYLADVLRGQLDPVFSFKDEQHRHVKRA